MKVCKVNSLPLKDVVTSLASCMQATIHHSCEEYYFDIPKNYGKGQVRGINFDSGLGIIVYQCTFNEDIRIDFTVDDVHPIKYIYTVEGPIEHQFANEDVKHHIEPYKCAIVASESNNGHVIAFKKNTAVQIVSLEIDRKEFIKNTTCEIDGVAEELQQLYKDVKAERTFYHEGFYGLKFKLLLSEISKYEKQKLIRKFYLESMSLQIFVHQLLQFEDDKLNDHDKTILRINELNKIEEIATFITNHLSSDLSVNELSVRAGLNSHKLQTGFKYIFNNTVNEYVTKQRLDKARELLTESELLISDVSLDVGFKSYSYFSRIFKENFGMKPSEYREKFA